MTQPHLASSGSSVNAALCWKTTHIPVSSVIITEVTGYGTDLRSNYPRSGSNSPTRPRTSAWIAARIACTAGLQTSPDEQTA